MSLSPSEKATAVGGSGMYGQRPHCGTSKEGLLKTDETETLTDYQEMGVNEDG